VVEKYDVIVVGGGPAGMTAASRIKRLKPSMRVAVFERSGYVSYAPCGLPYYLGGLAESIDWLVHYTVDVFRKRGIDVFTRAEVVEVAQGYARVRVGGEEKAFEWDKLILATGARPRLPPIRGLDLEGVFTLRTLEDGERAKRGVQSARRVAVIGGGYIGLEVAENLKRVGKEVVVFEILPHVMPTLDPDVAVSVEEELTRNGVELHLGEKVVELAGGGKVEKVVTDKGEYRVDAVFVATGVAPETELAKQLGVKLGATGAVQVSKRMETSVENVYAAGDAAEATNLVTGKPDWFPLAPVANKMGYVAGANAAGLSAEFPGAVGTAITKIFNLEVGRTGLTEERARREGFEPVSVKVETATRPRYYPGGSRIAVKLIADRRSGRLLGGQIVGGEGVLARVNALATLLAKGGTVEDLFFADLAYAPPFAPVWDPLVLAARVMMRELGGAE
jgi:NADPH-dependent 2,4-dienoyl-CoA reductase/sulfur reductase-like enzyme